MSSHRKLFNQHRSHQEIIVLNRQFHQLDIGKI